MLILTNASIIDGIGDQPVGGDLAVEGERIVAVGRGLPVPVGARVIDLGGMSVMPGLIDAHTHIGGSEALDRPGMSTAFASYNFAHHRECALRWGVTTVRSVGDFHPDILDVRDMADAGALRSPRIIASSKMFYAEGSHPGYSVFFSDEAVLEHASVVCGPGTDLVREVTAQCEAGVDWVKAFYSHMNKMAFPDTKTPRLTLDQLRQIVDTAHRHGTSVTVHVDDIDDMRQVLQTEVDCIEHVINVATTENHELPEDVLDQLVRRGIWVVPTMVASRNQDGGIDGAPLVYPALEKAVGQMIRAGVKLGVGCDSGIPFVPYGECVHVEMELLTGAGMTPMQAIKAATAANAELLRRGDQFGKIAPGLAADLVVVGNDPAADIRNSRDIRLVMRGGAIVEDRLMAR